MSSKKTKAATIDAYIRALPPGVQDTAQRIRDAIRGAVPEATEAIKYDMPTFLVDGAPFLYFAVWKKHVGMYPIYAAPPDLEAKIGPYRDKKDTVRFLLDEPMPYDLIATLASFKRDAVRSSR